MSKYGVHVDDFDNWMAKRHTKEYVLHRARCCKLLPTRTFLDIMYDSMENVQMPNGWQHSHYPKQRERGLFSEEEKLGGEKRVSSINLSELSGLQFPEKPRYDKISGESTRKSTQKKSVQQLSSKANQQTRGVTFCDTHRSQVEKEPVDGCEGFFKRRWSIPSVTMDEPNMVMTSTSRLSSEKLRREAQFLVDRREELHQRRWLHETDRKLHFRLSSLGKHASENCWSDNGMVRDGEVLTARERRRRTARPYEERQRISQTTTAPGTGTPEAFRSFCEYEDRNIHLKPTFPKALTEDDPPEYKALASQILELDLHFGTPKRNQNNDTFPYSLTVREKRLKQGCYNTCQSMNTTVKVFTNNRLEVHGLLSARRSEHVVKYQLIVLPIFSPDGKVSYKGVYRRQMKKDSQYMTWCFDLSED